MRDNEGFLIVLGFLLGMALLLWGSIALTDDCPPAPAAPPVPEFATLHGDFGGNRVYSFTVDGRHCIAADYPKGLATPALSCTDLPGGR
jgi:hypothetical protein